jgi:hypothetical protein
MAGESCEKINGVLVCTERKVLLAGCWWLICSERKVLLVGG